ncbi:MAG: methyltransferase domain-containing protein [Rhodospirillales bacterium]|nr:methyltransferase domain-containing protein [Alphaproteobacteria bacterium]MBL6948681.1 methyltransferase domain-containing protein [Rhodospirillales bacterium]
MRHAWNPGQYLKFGGHRLRPAIDLLARVDVARIDEQGPETVFDLGCGPGNSTRLLAERWPKAGITGVDGSAGMLEQAAKDLPGLNWVEADLNTWTPGEGADVLFSNAALHWLDDHAVLFPRLLAHLKPGGVLAVQMPGNYAAPSHMLIKEAMGPWRNKIEPVMRPDPVGELSLYYDALSPVASHLDIWETIYMQALEGENAAAEWLKGSALKPLLDVLDEEEAEAFFAAYSELTRKAYPKRPDGKTLYPFRRVFVVAKK